MTSAGAIVAAAVPSTIAGAFTVAVSLINRASTKNAAVATDNANQASGRLQEAVERMDPQLHEQGVRADRILGMLEKAQTAIIRELRDVRKT